MRYTTKIGTYLGVPVRVHATFPLILVIFGADGWAQDGIGGVVWAVGFVLCVFLCVVLHELGHSLLARQFGVRVRDIVLLPIGGLARAERIPESAGQEIAVAVAGPLVNFTIAGALLVGMHTGGMTFDLDHGFIANIVAVNVVLGVFNLVPAFPMDGGRILRGLLAMRMSYVTATHTAKSVGQLIALCFIVAGFCYSTLVMLPLIAVFIFWGAITEDAIVRARAGLPRVPS